MQHWQPERPARPAPMERWVFVWLIFYSGVCNGSAVAAGLICGPVWPVLVLAASGAIVGSYVLWSVKESGWPK